MEGDLLVRARRPYEKDLTPSGRQLMHNWQCSGEPNPGDNDDEPTIAEGGIERRGEWPLDPARADI